MRISIITPSYNHGEFIEETIHSVMSQNHRDVEHLVIDGGSTDNTILILKKYPHLRWVSERDKGQSNAINKGLSMASGEIVAWLNSDDFYEPNIFKDIARYFERHPDCFFLYGDMAFVDRNGTLLSKVVGDTMNYESLIACPDIVRQPSCFWRRIVAEELGGLDETLSLVMDFDFFLRIAQRYKLHYLSRNFSYYRYYRENKSLSMARRQVAEIYRVYKKNGVKLKKGNLKFLALKYARTLDFRKRHTRRGESAGRYSNSGNRKSILFVDDCTGRTGSTVSMEYLVKGFKTSGYNVYVLTSKTDPVIRSILEKHAVLLDARKWRMKTIALDLHFTRTLSLFSVDGLVMAVKNLLKSIFGTAVVWKAINDSHADIVYCNEYAVLQGSIAACLRRIPSVMHIRSRFLKGTFGVRRAILSRMIPLCNKAVFAISQIEADQLRQMTKHQERIRVVGEFFSLEDARMHDTDKARKAFGLPARQKIVTMLGGILAIKGTIDFLRAAERIAQDRKDVLFVLAGKSDWKEGDGEREYFDLCTEVIGRLLKANRIKVLGEITNSMELVSVSDIIVSPSRESHFSRPVIEAWGFGKPVLAVRTNHMEGLVADNSDGLLVPSGDDKAIADALARLLDDRELRTKLGRLGKAKVLAKFNAGTNIDVIVDTCNSLICSN